MIFSKFTVLVWQQSDYYLWFLLIFHSKPRQPHWGTVVRGPKKARYFWEPWMSKNNLVPIHPVDIEIIYWINVLICWWFLDQKWQDHQSHTNSFNCSCLSAKICLFLFKGRYFSVSWIINSMHTKKSLSLPLHVSTGLYIWILYYWLLSSETSWYLIKWNLIFGTALKKRF